jgi:hypothetical protein
VEYQRVNRTDPERFFVVVRNSYSTAALSNGQWCGWDTVTDQDGVNVTKISGIIRACPAGVAIQTIPAGDYGLIQVWGYKRDARCLGGTGGTAASRLLAGGALKFRTSGFAAHNFAKDSGSLKSHHGKFPAGIFLAFLNTAGLTTNNTTGAAKVLIRCL